MMSRIPPRLLRRTSRHATCAMAIAAAFIVMRPTTARSTSFELTLKIPLGAVAKVDPKARDLTVFAPATLPVLLAGVRTGAMSFSLGAGIGRLDHVFTRSQYVSQSATLHLIGAPTFTIDIYRPKTARTTLYLLAAPLIGVSHDSIGTNVKWRFEYGGQLAAGLRHPLHPHFALGAELGVAVEQLDTGDPGLNTFVVVYAACVVTIPFGE